MKRAKKGESSSNHVVVPTDAASAVDMDTNKHNSLNNIDQTMSQMAGLIARIYEGRRPSGRKRSKRSADPSSDTDDVMSPSQNMNISPSPLTF